ncbi:MAG: hypothetical protein KAS94_00100 [Desulfobulbaceae bacterium]|nr:hypothetical protein [Desulfobulbaceae bacterium]
MAEQKRINERLIALVFLGIIALNYPLLGLVSKKLFFCGVPLLYLYIFSLWFLFIMVLALVMRKRGSPTSTPETGP